MASLKEINARLEQIRSEAAHAIELLRNSLDAVEQLADAQQESFDNMPQGLQQSENGQKSEARAEAIREIFEVFESAFTEIDGITWEIK